jgi:hypothetical protein
MQAPVKVIRRFPLTLRAKNHTRPALTIPEGSGDSAVASDATGNHESLRNPLRVLEAIRQFVPGKLRFIGQLDSFRVAVTRKMKNVVPVLGSRVDCLAQGLGIKDDFVARFPMQHASHSLHHMTLALIAVEILRKHGLRNEHFELLHRCQK